jgi:Cu-Zn family superoxide dismutase
MLKALSSVIVIAGAAVVASAYPQSGVRAAEVVNAAGVPISANAHPNGSGAMAPASSATAKADPLTKAKADLRGPEGSDIEGDAEFYQTSKGVFITAEVENAPPGMDGIRIHQIPNCTDLKAMSMGGDFNPTHGAHALRTKAGRRQLGDLGHIAVDSDGYGSLEINVHKANLRRNSPTSLLNRSIVISLDHASAKEPSGDSSVPIACGVIEPRVD